MSDLVEWVKPCGASIKINSAPATIAKAESLGWKPAAKKAAKPAAKKD